MNWKRIIIGGLFAGIVFAGLDFVVNVFILGQAWKQLQQAGFLLEAKPFAYPVIFFIHIGIGFIVMWLYALARPRLGPGPKTALVIATLTWGLLYIPAATNLWLWHPFPTIIPLVMLISGFFQCVISTYLAGWQYIEKAP